MNKIKILIVEDEPLIAHDISGMLSELEYDVSGIKYTIDEAIEHIEKNKIDLILLDINLEGEKEGIDLAHLLNTKYIIPFIFISSYSDKVTLSRVKLTAPLAYLVKPIDQVDLSTTIEVALHNHNNKEEVLIDKVIPNTIFIKDGNGYKKLFISEILYAESFDNYCFVHTVNKKYMLSHTLKKVALKLEHNRFLRIHRSYLINVDHVTKFETGYVFINKKAIPVSKQHRKMVYQHFSIL